jgi:hypothetical protein
VAANVLAGAMLPACAGLSMMRAAMVVVRMAVVMRVAMRMVVSVVVVGCRIRRAAGRTEADRTEGEYGTSSRRQSREPTTTHHPDDSLHVAAANCTPVDRRSAKLMVTLSR